MTALFVTLVGAKGMLLVSAAFLCVAIVAILFLRAWAERTGAVGIAVEAPIGGSIWAGLTDVVRSPYLLGICAFLFAYSLLSTFLYFQQAELVPAAIPDRRTLPRGELADEVRDAAKLRSPTIGGMPASRIEGLARHWHELARGL